MSSPLDGDLITLKRVVRYLRGRPICKLYYDIQEPVTCVQGYSDADWAGDAETRKSTSGGLTFLGSHAISWYSRVQARVALSSCEAELNAMVKCMTECVHVKHLGQAFGQNLTIELVTDASAARGVLMRIGAGKLKHLMAKQLWVQDFVSRGEVLVTKVPRESNVADALTHCWAKSDLKHFIRAGFAFFAGCGQTHHDRARRV